MIKRQMLRTVSLCFFAIVLPLQTHAADVLRITTIPEEAASEQIRKFTPLANYLEKRLAYRDWETDRKSTRLNSSHSAKSRMPSSA